MVRPFRISDRQTTDYHLLNNADAEATSSSKGLSSVSMDYPRLTTIWTPTPMSPARRACVLASVMFGVLVTVVFVWVMPCGVDDLCGVTKAATLYPGIAGSFSHDYRSTWMQVLENTGNICLLQCSVLIYYKLIVFIYIYKYTLKIHVHLYICQYFILC